MLSRKIKFIFVYLLDVSILLFCNLVSFMYFSRLVSVDYFLFILVIEAIVYSFLGVVFHVFRQINRYTSLRKMLDIFLVLWLTFILEFILTSFLFGLSDKSFYLFFDYLLATVLILSSRIIWQLLIERWENRFNLNTSKKRVLLVGAGSGGALVVNELSHQQNLTDLKVVGFVDEDCTKIHSFINGIEVLGTLENLYEIIQKNAIDIITITVSNLSSDNYEYILSVGKSLGCTVNQMPTLKSIIKGEIAATKFRKIEISDLLGRDEVVLPNKKITSHLSNKTILITGAGGSIGSEICRQLIAFKPSCLILLGHGENSIYQIHQELISNPQNTFKIIPVIVDVQDAISINEIIEQYQPHIIYHAAAHKHVPLMEENPKAAVQNNIIGTMNVAKAAQKYKVDSFVMISTDKATHPPNVMGATKRISEMLITGLNQESSTKFSAVRFGNVLGSRGSVVPLFTEQIKKGGPVTITDFRMTRYFMTIPEASRLVIQAGTLAAGGEIFILDMGKPVRIYDLAEKMIKLSGYSKSEISIIESGIRPGEKLYEELLVTKERAKKQVHEKIFVGNIKGFKLSKIYAFLNQLPEEKELLMDALITFANDSIEPDKKAMFSYDRHVTDELLVNINYSKNLKSIEMNVQPWKFTKLNNQQIKLSYFNKESSQNQQQL